MPLDLEELRLEALGTTCHLLGIGLEKAALAEAAAAIADLNGRLSRFLPDSELCRFNASAGSWTDVSPELEALLRLALDAYERSGGLVHAGVLEQMLAIGYTRPLAQGPTPALPAAPGRLPPLPDLLEVQKGQARVRAGTGIDLGGLAKGWMADRLPGRVGGNCLGNLGGDLFGRGGGPEGEGWPVKLGEVTVLLGDRGAATSGTRRRRWTDRGEELHHLIDPRTGRPARSDLTEVAVIAASGADAEIAAKTALLLGSERAAGYLAANTDGWWLS